MRAAVGRHALVAGRLVGSRPAQNPGSGGLALFDSGKAVGERWCRAGVEC